MSNIPHTIIRTRDFDDWLFEVPKAQQIIIKDRLERLTLGHIGDHKRFDGLIELRWKNGSRVYAFIKTNRIFITLLGGNKNGQDKDIRKAKKIKEAILKGAYPLH